MLAIGDCLQNRYRVVRQLGHGGMGTVYEAHDERFEISVALKEVLLDLAKIADPTQQQMVARAFEREAKTLALLHHEAFPHVIDYFSESDHQYLIMELVHGEDLGEQLQARKKPFDFEDVLNWTNQLLDALDYLHTQEQPIIHRDLKPQNMKITGRNKVKVLDFGIAKGADNKSSSTITNQTFVAATLNYSPIEQLLRVLDPTFREFISQRHKDKVEDILEHTADARSDLYSLGATVYQLLTATQPHDTLKRALDLWAGKPDPLPNPMELNPKIPPYFNSILLKSMEIDRDSRYNSAAEMQKAIKEYMENETRTESEFKQAAWIAEQQKHQAAPIPDIGMQTQIRISEELKFLEELDSPASSAPKAEALPPLNQQKSASAAPPPFIPPVNEAEEQRRIAEQQKFLADLDAPSSSPAVNPPQAQQSNAALTDYGQMSPSYGNQGDQTNYAPQQQQNNASFDQTQVSYLSDVLPAARAKGADATIINSGIKNEAVAAPPIQVAQAETAEKKNNLFWLVPVGAVAALLVVCGIGFAAYFALSGSPKTDPTPTPSYTPSAKSSPVETPAQVSSETETITPSDTTSSETVKTPEVKSTQPTSTKRETAVKQEREAPRKTVDPPPSRPDPAPKQPASKPPASKPPSSGGGVSQCKILGTC